MVDCCASTGELLPEGVPGTDAAREAKVEETLRKMGVQSASDTKLTDPTSLEAKKAEIRRMGERINSIFDVSASILLVVCARV